ncbi:MAG: hypothetical protein AAF316_08780 [Cyanobacteria bacterium P01_A01_bin.80]
MVRSTRLRRSLSSLLAIIPENYIQSGINGKLIISGNLYWEISSDISSSTMWRK